MTEKKGIYFGANITGGEGGSGGTRVVCDAFRERWGILYSVNEAGAVTRDPDLRFQRLDLEDLGDGVQVHRGVNDNPTVKPGKKLEVTVGDHKLTIEGTNSKGFKINGNKPTLATDKVESIRYPGIKHFR